LNPTLKQILTSLASIALAYSLGMFFVLAAGESPLLVSKVLFRSAIASQYDLGMTFFYAIPFALAGFSVALAYRSGLFNIGAEGQLNMGALGCAMMGIFYPNLPAFVAPFAAIFAALLFGGLWGLIPAVLKTERGSHEVVTSIMLNFIAAALCSYFILYILKNPESQNPESKTLGSSYLFKSFEFFQGAPVGIFLFAIPVLSILIYFFFEKSILGFEMKSAGSSLEAAEAAGISARKIQWLSFALAGATAGLIGSVEILSNSGKFKMDFSPGYGFSGIAVCLLARGNPLLITISALFFAWLHKGAMDLDIETEKMTRDMTSILQALIIAVVASQQSVVNFVKMRRRKFNS